MPSQADPLKGIGETLGIGGKIGLWQITKRGRKYTESLPELPQESTQAVSQAAPQTTTQEPPQGTTEETTTNPPKASPQESPEVLRAQRESTEEITEDTTEAQKWKHGSKG